MYLVRNSDGKIYPDIQAAVEDFKCPGPCDPDCPLHPVKDTGAGTCVHMCHEKYYSNHAITVADAIGCRIVMQDLPAAEAIWYAAVIRSRAVRDVQTCVNAGCDPEDDDAWEDVDDAEVFLGFFRGTDALRKAAEYGRTDPANIRLVQVPENT